MHRTLELARNHYRRSRHPALVARREHSFIVDRYEASRREQRWEVLAEVVGFIGATAVGFALVVLAFCFGGAS